MLDKLQIVNTAAQPAAIIRLTIPRHEIRDVMGPARQEVLETVTSQGHSPAGPWFSHHLQMDPQIFDFEVGVPVSKPVSPAGRVTAGELPATRVARANYRGPYEGLGSAWGELKAWIAAQGLSTAPNLWECYVSGTEASPNPADWCTELNWPLLD